MCKLGLGIMWHQLSVVYMYIQFVSISIPTAPQDIIMYNVMNNIYNLLLYGIQYPLYTICYYMA